MNNRIYDWDQDHPRIKWLLSAIVFLIALVIGMVSVRGQFGVEQPIFQSSRAIVLQTIQITNNTENLTNYPVLIPLTDTNFNFDVGSSSGNDVRFVDSDGTTPLKFWIESWDSVFARLARVWVKIPLLTVGVDKTIYVYRETGGSDQSSATNTFILGYDFTDGITNGLVMSTSSNATISIEATTNWFSGAVRVDAWGRYLNNPVLDGTASAWDSWGVRDLNILIDTNNNIARESGLLIGYFQGKVNGTTNLVEIGRATSPDGLTWTKYASNPVLTTGAAGTWDAVRTSCGTTIKRGTGDYVMLYSGQDARTASQLGLAFSSDGLSWTKYASNPVMTTNQFQSSDIDNSPLLGMAAPFVRKLASGSWFVVFEGAPNTSPPQWQIYGASSTDLTNWTAFNSKKPIFPVGTGWEDVATANPKFYEPTSGNYYLVYNGLQNNAGSRYSLGQAYSTDWLTWTKYAYNPFMTKTITTGGFESDAIEQGSIYLEGFTKYRKAVKGYYQAFTNYANGSASITEMSLYQGTRLKGYGGTAAGDAWCIGYDLDALPVNFEARISVDDAQLDDQQINIAVLSLQDRTTSAQVTDNTTWNAERRVTIQRTPWGRNDVNGWSILYFNSGGTANYWNGSTWSTTAYYKEGHGRAIASLASIGTNFVMSVVDEYGKSFFPQATIPASSVKAFTSGGRSLGTGEPYTNFFFGSELIEHYLIRYKATNEPSVSVTSP